MELAAALDVTAAVDAAATGRRSFQEGGFMIFQALRGLGFRRFRVYTLNPKP